MAAARLEIVLAESAGFCMGVRRALKMTLDAVHDPAAPRPIVTEGPLIHNRQVLEVLDRNEVRVMQDEGEPAGTVVIRAHGVPPERMQELEVRWRRLIDATCPHVRNVQKIAERYCGEGWHCIIAGDPGHAEVEGVLAYAGGRGLVVSKPEDVAALPPLDRVVVVAQTTQDQEAFARVVERVRARYPQCKVFDTICRSTQRRQAEARELAARVDAMVVVGGFDSANTCRLAQICAATGTPTFHVETDAQLDLDRVFQCRRVGVTAGASTPHWMIVRVIQRLRSEYERRRRPARHLLRTLLWAPLRVNLFLGGGAAAMVFAVHRLALGDREQWMGWCMAVAAFFLTGQHLLHQCARREAMQLGDPDKGSFFQANARTLQFLGVCCGLLAVFLAALLPGWGPLALVLPGTAAGWLYALASGPSARLTRRLRWVARVPGAKELFVGLAWAVTVALVPALAAGPGPSLPASVAPAALLCFLMAGQRTLLTDLLDLEADQLVGRETLAGVLGRAGCKRLALGLLAGQVALLAAGAAGVLDWTRWPSSAMLLAVGYSGFCFLQFLVGKLPEGERGEVLIDATFYACGLAALAGAIAR